MLPIDVGRAWGIRLRMQAACHHLDASALSVWKVAELGYDDPYCFSLRLARDSRKDHRARNSRLLDLSQGRHFVFLLRVCGK